MSEFLSRIKARLETGQHQNSSSSEEPGWVRAALANMDKEAVDTQEAQEGGRASGLYSEWQAQLVEQMKGVGLRSVDGPPSLTKSRSSPALGSLSSQNASQALWESKVLDSRLPNGFYSVIPSRSMKARFPTIPTLRDLQQLGPEAASLDVLLVDTTKDKTIVALQELAQVLVKGLGANVPLMIKKIADLVADFYGGPLFEAGSTKSLGDEKSSSGETGIVRLLGEVKLGLCRPRAILFKLLGDTVGLPSRLLMGLQLEAVPSSSLICANPNKHMSNVVAVNGIDLLVDVMRHPGYLRPFSRKALVTYHIAGAGDSDSAEYDSCDSPLEPNSPLYGVPDKLEHEILEHDVDNARQSYPRRGLNSAAVSSGLMHLNPVLQRPVAIAGRLSPSQSEPDLANPRRRNRRRAPEERTAGSSPESFVEAQQGQRRSLIEEVHSFPSSPENPQTRLRPFQRVGSEEGSVSSSPEHPVFRARAPSMLSGTRLHSGEDINVSSPDESPQHPCAAGKPSPVFRRRSACSFSTRPGENGRRERALSVDTRNEERGLDFLQFVGDSTLSRPNHSPHAELRKARKRNDAPEISDEVVRQVRAMNKAMKQERFRTKEQESYGGLSGSDGLSPDSRQGSEDASGRSLDPGNIDMEVKQSNEKNVSFSNTPDYTFATTSSSDFQEVGDAAESGQEKTMGGLSRLLDTNSGATSWSLTMQSPSLPTQPLMPFSEWNIEFSELRIGIRVGIGSFGQVFRGMWRGTEVAIKVMLEQDLTEENTQDFCNEISLLSRLRHPNVILFLGACTKPPHLSMVTEYMHMGSLYSLIHSSDKKLSWRRRLKMLRDICRGMMSVERMKIVHRDLKSANCLVDKHWSVKICDFGLSRIIMGSGVCDQTAVGTPEWTAPELLRNEPVTDKCDVFSFGVIMWELSTLKRPWDGVKPMQVVYAVAHNRARLEIPDSLIGKLIADCWEEVPAARPGYEEILTRLHECEFLQS